MVLPGKGLGWGQFFKELKGEWKKDRIGDTAGALTYFAVLALFPFILFAVSLAAVIIEPGTVEQLIRSAGQLVPPHVQTILAERLRSLQEGGNAGLLTVGALTAIWAASGGMMALIRALNLVYEVEESRPFWKVRLIAIGMTLGTAALAVVAMVVAIFTPVVADTLGEPLGTVLRLLRLPVAGAVMMFLWATLYYVLPNVKQKFKFITPGSIFAVAIWVLASWGFSLYVANFGKYEATYGSLGGVIVLLFWMWISAQVLLLGAEINGIIEHHSPEGKDKGEKVPDEDKAFGLEPLPPPPALHPTPGLHALRPAAPSNGHEEPSRWRKPGLVGAALGAAYLLGRRSKRDGLLRGTGAR
jgi:membrane protein